MNNKVILHLVGISGIGKTTISKRLKHILVIKQ